MKILFVNQHTGSRTVPLASACLAATLEEYFGDGVDCQLLELPPGFSIEDSCRDITEMSPDLILLTLYIWSRTGLLALAASLGTTSSGKESPIIIAGGPEVTAEPLSVHHAPGISLAVAGEGEEAIRSIVEGLLAGGTILGEPDKPMYAPVIPDPGTLPSPWTASFLKGQEWDDYVWELTRGCPFSCHFCFESKGSKKVRHKNLERAEAELQQLLERGARRVFLLDPTFNASPRRAVELLDLFLDKAPDISWHLEVRSEFLDEEQAAHYAELGCVLQIGLQTADEEVARNIGRPYSREDFAEKVLILHEYGVAYGLDLIWGLPGDNLDGFRNSLNFALGCAPNHLDLFPLSVLPGTRLRDDAAALGLPYRNQPPYTITGSHSFPEEDLNKAAALAATTDRLYNRSRAVPWFLTVCEALEMEPVELIDAAAETSFASGDVEEKEQPAHLAAFIRNMASTRDSPEVSDMLADMVALLTIESSLAESFDTPDIHDFSFDPLSLMDHLEMGINDPLELSAFVSRSQGTYHILVSDEGLSFRLE